MIADKTAPETSETTLTANPGEQAITIARTFDAPRERVFEETGDRTRLAIRDVFQSVEDRDAMFEEGAGETWERFADLVAKPNGGDEQ
ncbi:hypothetical protein [Haladaptatus salinisoli]|uniref:hypothetical protein n=1 Tax=Haladaptatus salinisoli TaxID=2884876 RepID=UPI001D099EF6|nr:hypothetical protein [Haladaptatus salinisoli]